MAKSPFRTLLATPQTDARLKREYTQSGGKAYRAGQARSFRGDPKSMIAAWWFQGYDMAASLGAPDPKPATPALVTRLRKAGRDAEADVVAAVYAALQTHPEGDNGLLSFCGTLSEASKRLDDYHRRQGALDA
jgi:hypothetical protein